MKPIIGAQGEFVTLPACDAVVFYPQSYRGGWSVKIDQAKYLYEDGIESDDLAVLDYYATREAAEMALIRAKALQRLKAMAYGKGWLPPEIDAGHGICTLRGVASSDFEYDYNLGNIRFNHYDDASEALETITPAERAAFLYVYKPTEGE